MPERVMQLASEQSHAPPSQLVREDGAEPLRVLFCVNWPVDRLSEPDSSRFSPDYLVSGQPYWFFKHVDQNVHVDVLDCRSILRFDRVERRLAHCYPSKGILAWLRSRRYDVILCHGAQMGLVVGMLQSLFPNMKQTPTVMFDVGSISGGYNGWRHPKVIQACKFAIKSLSAAICHSSEQFKFYNDRYPEVTKIAHFIPLGVDTTEFQPEPCVQEDEIICVGYSMRKWELLLRAYASLNTKTRLVLLGIPRERFIDQAGVICIPRVGIDEMRNWIRKAKFVVLPIPDVDFCIGQQTFLQCMALGKTVLLPSIPAVRDYIRDGETGVLYDVNSEEDLARKLGALLSSSETVERIGRAARDATETQFAETFMADRVVALLRDVVRSGQSANDAP